MPEGPSLVILKEAVALFKGKKILRAEGNAKFDKSILVNKTIKDFRTWGKQFFIIVKGATIRIHFLMFGSYSVDTNVKPDRSIRLSLFFSKGAVYFYTCAVKPVEDIEENYDWEADVMSDIWNPARARKKIKALPDEMVCDLLLDQNIFSGVGNIIKNEVLYRLKIHPESRTGNLPPRKLTELIKHARQYSFEFLEWKKAFVLKKHWLAHTKKTCLRCNLPIIKIYSGKTKRRSFYCENCQVVY